MSEKELINWFQKKLNNCYIIQKDDEIYWIYDKNYIRAKKLALIDGRKVDIPENHKNLFFKYDLKKQHLTCDYNKIWYFLKINYSFDRIDIKTFIIDRMYEFENLNQYIIHSINPSSIIQGFSHSASFPFSSMNFKLPES